MPLKSLWKEKYLDKFVVGFISNGFQVLRGRAVVQFVIVHNLVLWILVHKQGDHV